MGCQKKITDKIIEQNGDYAIALKANQPTIHNEVLKYFETQLLSGFEGVNVGYSIKEEKGHGRIENSCHWILAVAFRGMIVEFALDMPNAAPQDGMTIIVIKS